MIILSKLAVLLGLVQFVKAKTIQLLKSVTLYDFLTAGIAQSANIFTGNLDPVTGVPTSKGLERIAWDLAGNCVNDSAKLEPLRIEQHRIGKASNITASFVFICPRCLTTYSQGLRTTALKIEAEYCLGPYEYRRKAEEENQN